MVQRIEIDHEVLQSGTATAIAKRTGLKIDTVLARQREAGIAIRAQGKRDHHREILKGVPSWMNDSPTTPTRTSWS